MHMHHYTDNKGYNAIVAASPWRFLAAQPPGQHPLGAYFTTLPPSTPNLAQKLRLPRGKIEYVFIFVDQGDLLHLPGGRGKYILYSPQDYEVEAVRQVFAGEA